MVKVGKTEKESRNRDVLHPFAFFMEVELVVSGLQVSFRTINDTQPIYLLGVIGVQLFHLFSKGVGDGTFFAMMFRQINGSLDETS